MVEALRAMTNLSRDFALYSVLVDPLVLKSLSILIQHSDADIV